MFVLDFKGNKLEFFESGWGHPKLSSDYQVNQHTYRMCVFLNTPTLGCTLNPITINLFKTGIAHSNHPTAKIQKDIPGKLSLHLQGKPV